MAERFAVPATGDLPGITDLKAIGKGGFATVYQGWQPAFRRSVAVKIFDEQPGASALVRLRKEIEAMGSLSGHPHVVPVYDADVVEGRPYLVMPYLSGRSLQERLAEGPLPVKDVVDLGVAMADALSAAHDSGLLHRDVKPGNILYTGYGDAQLSDFGIARFADSTLTNGEVNATVSYAAPEVLSGQRATAAADVYGLGATLYAALTGAPPFAPRPHEAPMALALRVVQQQPRDLRESGVPSALARVVDKAMSKRPADRYASAAELGQALRSVGHQLPSASVADAQIGLPGHPATPHRRRRDLVGAGVVAALVTAALVAVASTMLVGHPRSTAAPPGTARPHQDGARSVPSTATSSVPSTATSRATSASTPTTAHSTAPPTTAPPTTEAPTTAGAASPGPAAQAVLGPASVEQFVRSYYRLVNEHRLSTAWGWLTSSYQNRLGVAYYNQFWDSIRRVQVLTITPGNGTADLTLRYQEASGAVSVENAVITFAAGSGGKVLISSYAVS